MIRRRLAILLCCECLILIGGCSDRLGWRSDWKVAMAEASHDRVHTLVMFASAMCSRCWHMDRKVFTDPALRDLLNDYKLIRLDIFLHREMAREYGFTGTPSFVVYNSRGRVIGTRAGAMDAPTMIRFLKQSRMTP